MAKKPKRRPVKPEHNPNTFTVYRPEFAPLVEVAFKSGGKNYYWFIKDTQIRTGRYMVMQNLLQEVNLRMDRERFLEYVKRIISELDGTRNVVNVGNALAFLGHMKTMGEMAFEPDTVYRLASVIFFDDTEDLRTWDKKYNEKKIAGWKEDGTLDFFYSKPFKELIGLNDISETDLKTYLERAQELIDGYKSVLSSATREP